MIPWRRPRLWLALALAIVIIAAAALWLRGLLPGGGNHRPVLTPSASGVSPLPTPSPSTTAVAPPPSWTGAGAVLLWVALGAVLALGISLIILYWYRRAA